MIVTHDYIAIAAFCSYPKGDTAGDVKVVLDSLKERDRDIVQCVYSNDWVSRSTSVRAKAVNECAKKYHVSVDVVYRVLRDARIKLMKMQEHS